MDLRISLDDTQVRKKLHSLASGIKDFREPFEKSGDEMIKFFKKSMENNGKGIGDNWRKLSAATLKMRANRWGHYANTPIKTDKTLIWTGALQKGFVKIAGKTRLVVKNTVDYFKYHQKAGGTRPPQRKMLSINKDVIDILIKNINRHITKLIR